jgi:hypothetical protein
MEKNYLCNFIALKIHEQSKSIEDGFRIVNIREKPKRRTKLGTAV